MADDGVIEIRTYALRPGTRDEFHAIFTEEVAPLLARHGIRVVRAQASLVEDEPGDTHYTLIRAFDGIEHRAALEDAFYASDEWRNGPRERVLACIETYHTVVLEATRDAVERLSAPPAPTPADGSPEELRGERVTLRRAREDDVDALAAILAEPEVARWWGDYDGDGVRRELGGSFVIVVDGAVAGWLLADEEPDPGFRHVAFDIALASRVHGRGYGSEALRVAIRHFIDRGHHRFTIDPAVDNERAIRAYAAVGFKPVGVMRSYEQLVGREARTDNLLMDLLAEEFVARARRGAPTPARGDRARTVRELRVAVTAGDYDEALRFYRDVLGLEEREA